MSLLLLPSLATAQVELPFEGFLTDGADLPINGTIDVEVRVYEGAEGGTPLFEEVHTGVIAVGGFVYVRVGSVTPFPATIFQTGGARCTTFRCKSGWARRSRSSGRTGRASPRCCCISTAF